MNPEVRFRVPSSIYQVAEQKAEELLQGDYPGRSTAVSTLARKAFYAMLGIAEERRPPVSDRDQIEVEVRCGSRRKFFHLASPSLPPELEPWLSQPRCVLRWDDLPESFELEDVLARLSALRDLSPAGLRGWAREHGSELLRLRLEEGFEWLELARTERVEQLLTQAGLGPLVPVREHAGLGPGEEPSHAWLPDRQPGLEQIHRLRRLRQKAPPGVQLALVRVRRWSEPPGAERDGVLARLVPPDGSPLSFLIDV